MFISCVSPEACPGKDVHTQSLALTHTLSWFRYLYDKII